MNHAQAIGTSRLEAGFYDRDEVTPVFEFKAAGPHKTPIPWASGVGERIRAVLRGTAHPMTPDEVVLAVPQFSEWQVKNNLATMNGLIKTGVRGAYRYSCERELHK